MNHHGVDTNQLHEHDITRKSALECLIYHSIATVLDDNGLAAETAYIGQRLGKDMGDVTCRFGCQCHGCRQDRMR